MLNTMRATFLIAVFAALPQAASAQGLPLDIMRDVIHACRADYHRICPDVIPGGGRIARCLAAHEEALSPPCLTAVKFAKAVKACTPDYYRFCDGIQPGDGRVAHCLADNLNALGPDCYRVVKANAPYIDELHDGDDALHSDKFQGDRYGGVKGRIQDDRYAYRERRDEGGDRRYEQDQRYDDEIEDENEPIK